MGAFSLLLPAVMGRRTDGRL